MKAKDYVTGKATIQVVDLSTGTERHVKKLTLPMTGQQALEIVIAALERRGYPQKTTSKR
jgi:hypothetical protein